MTARHFLRLIYGLQSSPISKIDVKYVFCKTATLPNMNDRSLSLTSHNGIIILNCTENMNAGKTYTYFSSLPQIYDYVMKVDENVFLRLAPLASSLGQICTTGLLFCQSQSLFVDYMSGIGFVLSWDLMMSIRDLSIPANDNFGPEDKLVGKWLKTGNKAKNRFSNKQAMYDILGQN